MEQFSRNWVFDFLPYTNESQFFCYTIGVLRQSMTNVSAMLQRVLIDRELEEVSLGNDVTVQQKMINDALEVSCLLLNEFNSAIEHVKITKVGLSFTSFSLVFSLLLCRPSCPSSSGTSCTDPGTFSPSYLATKPKH